MMAIQCYRGNGAATMSGLFPPPRLLRVFRTLDIALFVIGCSLSVSYGMVMFLLTKAACCQNIDIVLHPTALSYIHIYMCKIYVY